MKRRYKYSIIILLFIVMITTFNQVKALKDEITFHRTSIKSPGEWTSKSLDGKTRYHRKGFPIETIKWKGQDAFCIQPAVIVGNGTGYQLGKINPTQADLFSKIIYHGFDKTAKTEQDNLFTQLAIWKNINPQSIDHWENVGAINFEKRFKQLMIDVNNHHRVASFANQSFVTTTNQPLILTDKNHILSQATLVSNGNLKVEKTGDTLKISSPKPTNGPVTITFKKFKESKQKVTPLVYHHEVDQDIIKQGSVDPVFFSIKVTVNQLGKLEIIKMNEQSQPIAKVEFEVSYDADFSKLIGRYTTSPQGKIIIENLQPKTVYVREVKTVKPYVLETKVQQVKINNNQQSNLKFINHQAKGQIIIHKKSSLDQKPLSKVSFDILNQQNQKVAQLVTNQQGIAMSQPLPLGQYYVVETQTVPGYSINPSRHLVDLNYQGQTIKLVSQTISLMNDPIRGSVEIMKVDYHNRKLPLAEVSFQLFNSKHQLIAEKKTNQQGVVIFSQLLAGDYYLKEKQSPKGYISQDEKIPFSIRKQNEVIRKTVTNQRRLTKISISKADEQTHHPLANAEFIVYDQLTQKPAQFYDSAFNPIAQPPLKTNILGKTTSIGYLPEGNYQLREVQSPQGYLSGKPVNFSVQATSKIIEKTMHINVTNRLTRVEIVKVDALNNYLEGAQLQLFDQNQQLIKSWTSNQTPEVFYGLSANHRYTLKEKQAPKGYLLGQELTFIVTDSPSIQKIVMVNHPIPQINTYALFENGHKEMMAHSNMKVTDRIQMSRLKANQRYTLKGKIINLNTNQIVSSTEKQFQPDVSQFLTTLKFELDGSRFLGHQLVVIEELFEGSKLVAHHIEKDNKQQTVSIPHISTFASLLKQEQNPWIFTIRDEVFAKNLIPHQTYQLKGQLINQKTGQPLLIDGKPIVMEKQFVASQPEQKEFLDFKIDARLLDTLDIVVYEELWSNTEVVAQHKEQNSVDQSVHLHEIILEKVDEKNPHRKLENAEFELSNGQRSFKAVTNQNGIVRFIVDKGTWYLVEVKAPRGYQLNKKKHTIWIDDHHKTRFFTLTNKPIVPPSLPKTGNQFFIISGIGILFILGGIGMLMKSNKADE